MPEDDEAMERIERLLQQSSLGAPGARQLRRRTPGAHVEAARQIYRLRSRMVHSGGSDAVSAAAALIDHLTELGYHGQANHVLHEWFPEEGQHIADIATSILLFDELRNPPRPARRLPPTGGRRPQVPVDSTPEQDGPKVATLTLAPASDRLPPDDPAWQLELQTLFLDLREHVGAFAIARGASPHAPELDEPFVLTVVFRYRPDTLTNLSACFGSWLNREPGRSLGVMIDAKRWSQRLVLRAGHGWSLAEPAEQVSDGERGAEEEHR